MPEAEEIIADAARHALDYGGELWRRHRQSRSCDSLHQCVRLSDICRRLELLITSVFGTSYPIRIAQPPAPPTFLSKIFQRKEGPRRHSAIPATDGINIWLPAELPAEDPMLALEQYRVLALQQATRAVRGSTHFLAVLEDPMQRSIFVILEAQAADAGLIQLLPGTRPSLLRLRAFALRSRPPLAQFPERSRPLEQLVRSLLATDLALVEVGSPADSVKLAQLLGSQFAVSWPDFKPREQMLFRDLWTGELRLPPPAAAMPGWEEADAQASVPRSARLPRRPEIRQSPDDEDDRKPGSWMVQTAQPHEQVEDPVGMQRPTDRDESAAAEEFADALSELPEARLVSTPGAPKEVLLSDHVPLSRARCPTGITAGNEQLFNYPEWDCRSSTYRKPGTTVRLLVPQEGPEEWIGKTLERYRSMLDRICRRFEMLRAQRIRLRKQFDGEEVDLEAYTASYSDFKAGLPMAQALYQSCRPARRELAIVLLIDVSGSTDGWISANKRVIDVEREALLLVAIALQGLADPYAMLAFSGQGPQGVTIRVLKSFEEQYSSQVARRIAATTHGPVPLSGMRPLY
jgi:nitric oxide reductase NorD protein